MKKVQVNAKEKWEMVDCIYDAIVEDDGAIKWESNGNYLMEDVMNNIIANGFTEFSKEATLAKREAQVKELLSNYRKNYKGPTEEQLAEMRAAYGYGAKVIDVITGDVITL